MISISQIWDRLKEVFKKMIGRESIEGALRVTPAISTEMINAIQLWSDMYENKAPWLKSPSFDDPSVVRSLGLPQLIASEKARTALLEFESEITTPMEEKEIEQTEEDLIKDSSSLSVSSNEVDENGQTKKSNPTTMV